MGPDGLGREGNLDILMAWGRIVTYWYSGVKIVDAGKHASSVIEGDIRTLGPTGWGFGGGSSIVQNELGGF